MYYVITYEQHSKRIFSIVKTSLPVKQEDVFSHKDYHVLVTQQKHLIHYDDDGMYLRKECNHHMELIWKDAANKTALIACSKCHITKSREY